MRSKTSFFNKTLYKKNLSRFWPLWALPSFGGALVPMTMLLQMVRQKDFHLEEMTITESYYAALHTLVPILSLLYAVLCAAAVWGYLYNSRSQGLMHRLPIRREGLFVTNFLSGMTMMLIPYVITGALTVLLTVMMGQLPVKALLLTVLGVLLESFFYFSSATFVAFLTGNASAMPVLYFLLHFLEPALDMLMGTLKSGFYYGVSGGYSGLLENLCPTVYLLRKIDVNHIYNEVLDPETQVMSQELVAVEFQNFWVIGVYALVGVVLLTLAYAIYRRRSSERAGDVAAVGWMRPVFRYSGALLAGLGGGMLLYTLVWRPFQITYDDLEIVPLVICMVIMGLIGYYAVSMLLEKSLRVFRGSVPGAAAVAVVLCLICAGFRFDVFGVERYVPKTEKIQTVELRVGGNDLTLESGRNDALIQKTLALHQTLIEDEGARIEASDYDYNKRDDAVNLRYTLKDGRTVHRNYDVRLTWERMNQEGTVDYLLNQLCNDPETLLARLHGDRTDLKIRSAELSGYTTGAYQSLNATQARQAYEAVLEDAKNGNWGREIWFEDLGTLQEILNTNNNFFREDGSFDRDEILLLMERAKQLGDPFAELNIWYQTPEDEALSSTLYIRVRPGMRETIACLRKLGVLKPDQLTVVETEDDTPHATSIAYEEGTSDEREQPIDNATVAMIEGEN